MSAHPQNDWVEANQRYLAAEFARLKAQLAGALASTAHESIAQVRVEMPSPAAIDELSEAFSLSVFERDVLLLCAGAQMDSELAAACAAGGDTSRPFATFGLALARLEQPHWSALTPVAPLRLWRLLDVKDEQAITTSRLTVDERVLHYLAGVNYLDPRLRPALRLHASPSVMADGHVRTLDELTRELQRATTPTIVQLLGDDLPAQKDIAASAVAAIGLRLHVLRAVNLPANVHEVEALRLLWEREGTLLRSALLIECEDADANTLARFVERSDALIFIASRQPVWNGGPGLRFAIDRPPAAEQKRLWVQALGSAAGRLNGAVDGVAGQFRFSADTIVRTSEHLRPALLSAEYPEVLLWRECRTAVRNRLNDLAQHIAPAATWGDLVLPEPQVAALRQIATHVRHRLTVHEQWGFAGKGARGLGISALFSGESGTGKTMAAEVLANELSLDLYRVDLASTVSKYIGETEKNLRRVFDAAEDSGAILLFDEADALFGKRSEVKDSHDRYANIEVSYLLQRMEAYRGLAILTTNAGAALDPAFQRRLRFTVQFPFPDHTQRERIWRGAFPAATPLVGLDPVRLAQLNVAGGSIRNIAMNAAFLAAESGAGVGMGHLLQAARSEAAKRERPFSDAELRGWVCGA
jgi:hypothetical protein